MLESLADSMRFLGGPVSYMVCREGDAAMGGALRHVLIQEAGRMRAIVLGIIAGLAVVLGVCVYLAVFRPA